MKILLHWTKKGRYDFIDDDFNTNDEYFNFTEHFYEDKDFKFYLYHVINAFQPGSNKIEKNSSFFKFGIGILLKNII